MLLFFSVSVYFFIVLAHFMFLFQGPTSTGTTELMWSTLDQPLFWARFPSALWESENTENRSVTFDPKAMRNLKQCRNTLRVNINNQPNGEIKQLCLLYNTCRGVFKYVSDAVVVVYPPCDQCMALTILANKISSVLTMKNCWQYKNTWHYSSLNKSTLYIYIK